MPSTSTMGFPYPAPTATPDVPYDLQQLAEAVDAALSNKPRCKISATAAQTFTTAVQADVVMAATNYDNNGMADLANNRIVIKTAGWYTLHFFMAWASNATGYRIAIFDAGGAGVHVAQHYQAPTPSSLTTHVISTPPVLLAVNDVVKLGALQGSGANLASSAANGQYPYIAAHWAYKA